MRFIEQKIKTTPTMPEPLKTKLDDDIRPENIIKQANNGHSLVMVKRTRVKGFCVECIKNCNDPQYKKHMNKIITHCPKCPGGSWICESCFDRKHSIIA